MLQLSQIDSYPNEYLDLLQGKGVSSQSKILNLTPIFNKNLIKVGGRLHSVEIPVQNKQQIVISKTHPIATLILQEIHQTNLHVGKEHTLSILREKYWTPSCRGVITKLIHDCLYCKRQNAKPDYPIIGNLPSDRTKMGNKPFSNVGVDCFGPAIVKLSKRTRSNAAKAKQWGVIFTV